MKYFCLFMLCLTASAEAQESEPTVYPLDIRVAAYPSEIHCGDICFFQFSVTNQGEETLYLPYGNTFFYTTNGQIVRDGNTFQIIADHSNTDCIVVASRVLLYPGRVVKPGETMRYYQRMECGFLVEMRYAENEEAEEKVFENLVTFVEKSRDKALWVNFIHDVALESIQNSNHFPQNKVESSRLRNIIPLPVRFQQIPQRPRLLPRLHQTGSGNPVVKFRAALFQFLRPHRQLSRHNSCFPCRLQHFQFIAETLRFPAIRYAPYYLSSLARNNDFFLYGCLP